MTRSIVWTRGRAWGAAMVALLAAGCTSPNAPVDSPQARQALVQALDAWQAGETPDALRAQTPSITVGDVDWEAGKQLASYEILPAENNDGANLHCTVKLKFKGSSGANASEQVTYIVGTAPVITIFRNQ